MKLVLQTLSPLHIGCNDSYSALTDYFYAPDRRKVILISAEKLEAALQSRSQPPVDLVESFINELRNAEFRLRNFLQSNEISLDEVAVGELDAQGNIRGEIHRFIYSAGGPFIPGSSLKGGFRTALAYTYLSQHAPGTLQDVIQNRLPRDRRQVKEAFKKSGLEERIFLDHPHRDPLKNIGISDSDPLAADSLKVYGVKRFYIAELERNSSDLRQGSPVPLECLPRGFTVELPFHFGRFLAFKREFSFLQNEAGVPELFGCVNQFSLASVNREIAEFTQRNPRRLSVVIRFYQTLQNQIQSLPPNQCILRLGFGKTFWDETVNLLISNDRDTVQRLEDYLNRNFWARRSRRRYPRDPLPTTRYFAPGQEVLGWVKLSLNP